jgi:hypothetical protein
VCAFLGFAQGVQQFVTPWAAHSLIERVPVHPHQVHGGKHRLHMSGEFAHFQIGQPTVDQQRLGTMLFHLRHGFGATGSFAHTPTHAHQGVAQSAPQGGVGAGQYDAAMR